MHKGMVTLIVILLTLFSQPLLAGIENVPHSHILNNLSPVQEQWTDFITLFKLYCFIVLLALAHRQFLKNLESKEENRQA